MTKKWPKKIGVLFIFVFVLVTFYVFKIDHYLSLENLKSQQLTLTSYYNENPIFTIGVYLFIYIVSTALSLPGALILTLAGGTLFGLWLGTLLASFASTIGATLSFLASRYFFRDYVQTRFADKLTSINQGIEKDGALYLFSLRLVPIVPFFLINLLMGLTSIKAWTYFFVSQIGMLPGTVAFVNAGTQLGQVSSLNGLLSPNLILSFALLGILPLISKSLMSWIKSQKYLRQFKKPKKFDYNMIVIGGGSAGLVSAYIASAVKAKVALIEKNKMGGDCLNTGCVPSKALIRSAKILNYAKRAKEFGFESMPVKFEFSKVMERVQNVIHEIAPHDSVERYTELGVDCIKGEAKIRSPYEVEVNGQVLTTKNIVVATGAGPFVPPIPGLNEVSYLTSDNVWNLKVLPKRLIVLGGGPIGCELAQSFARFGSLVTIVEMSSRILIREDKDVSDLITKKFKNEGITILPNHKATRFEKSSKTLICEHQGKEIQIQFDEILIALGRKAHVKGFGLEELGVEISERGTILADEYLRTTNYPNIYVCGDVTGPYQFTHTAAHQAWFAAVNALFSPFKKFKVDYRVIPWCTFTDPEVARVGLNELEAKEQGISYQLSHYGIDDLDRAITEGEAHGFVKILTKPGTDKILGATIVGGHAGDIICEYVAAMKHGFGLNKILGTIHIYPTFSEANKYAAGVWKKANAPKKALAFLARFHEWRRG